ncbi:Integrase-like protein [Salinicola sp. NYA28a]
MAVGIGQSTVARILKREGLNRLALLSPARPDNRYDHDAPGDLLHLDIKKLGRFKRPGHRVTGTRHQKKPGVGWEYVHVAIDDHSRVAFGSLHPDEKSGSACLALLKAGRHYASLGIRFSRVLTDNGACYRSHGSNVCVGGWGCNIVAPGRTALAPTARRNGSFRPFSVNGPMREPTQARTSEAGIYRLGFISTTGIARMPVWITTLRLVGRDYP